MPSSIADGLLFLSSDLRNRIRSLEASLSEEDKDRLTALLKKWSGGEQGFLVEMQKNDPSFLDEFEACIQQQASGAIQTMAASDAAEQGQTLDKLEQEIAGSS